MALGRSGMCLNEVQFPKELQPVSVKDANDSVGASMKCSSRRNCNLDECSS